MRPRLLLLFIALTTLTSCIHPKVKFRKSALLDPVMNPSGDITNMILMTEPSRGVERGNTFNDDLSLGANCPSCG